MKWIYLAVVLMAPAYLFAQEEAVSSCEQRLEQEMTFLTDGSFQDASVVQREIASLKSCGLDDYDITFFGRIEVLSTMLKKMTQDKLIDKLTYGDLYENITAVKATANFEQLKKLALLSQQLAETKATLQTWEKDRLIFVELGASNSVQDKVYKYLREHPENQLTYQELLMELKK